MRKRLKELRGSESLETVAKNIGITRQMMGFLESGERTPSLDVAKRVADYYGVCIDEIFFEPQSNDSLQTEWR